MDIIERVKAYYADHPENAASLPPPATLAAVVAAETQLGFGLPPILRELYLTLSNGGFGPEIIGLEGGVADNMGETLPDIYLDRVKIRPEDSDQRWPLQLVPFVEDGCGSFSCVDCSKRDAPVIGFDPNAFNPDEGTSWSDAFFPEKASLAEWFDDWLEFPY